MANQIQNVSRRGFLGTMLSAGAFVLGVRCGGSTEEAFNPKDILAESAAFSPDVFLGIEPDGAVYIVAHRSEMGTGSKTSLPMVLADELGADWEKVVIQQAIGDSKYGDQNTDGSRSIRWFYSVMREAGASARMMLEQAAAARWGVPAEEVKTELHEVVHDGKRLGFGELVADAAKLEAPAKDALKFKDRSEYRYVGHEMPVDDLDDICTGKGVFGQDFKIDGMVYASVEHPPVLGAKLISVDDAAALEQWGVERTVQLPAFTPPHGFQALGGVAVIANNTWSAFEGRKKLVIEWDLGPNAAYSSEAYKKTLQATAKKPGKVVRNVGNVDQDFRKGGKVLEAEYYVPHLAHAAMEPPAAVADFKDGKATVWSCTQNPQAVQDAVAGALGIDKANVTAHVTLLGGGFGRKSKPDYCCEAALLSRELGKPVKVAWSREDDIGFDYYHAVAALYLKARLGEDGKPSAWLQRSVFPPIGSTFAEGTTYGSSGEMGMGFSDVPFDIPNHRAENGPAPAHVRIGWMRAVANIYHAFAIHSFLDELAHAAGRDPTEYLLDVLGEDRHIDLTAQGVDYPNMGGPIDQYPVDTARLRAVIEKVRDESGWGKRELPKGHGLGIAGHRSFLTYVANVVEVAVDDKGKVTIPNVWTAVDAGLTVNPERCRSQFEGAAVFGASLAMMGAITATDGKIDQSNFHDYPVARIQEAPQMVHVYMIENDHPPAGIGEPGVPPFAPALCNAIFAATGKRVRELPVGKQALV
jgi:isoquinoline 1-oxidoreductase beta subunit